MIAAPRSLWGKRLLQHRKHRQQGGLRQHPEVLDQAFTIHRAELIGHRIPILSFETAWDPKGVAMASGGQRSHNEGTHVGVEFVE